MLSLTIVKEFEALERRRADWLDLLSRAHGASPSLWPSWLLSWWQVFGDEGGRSLRVGLLYKRGRLVALAPFLSRSHRYRLSLPFRRLELLGSGEQESDEICSDYLGIVAEAGLEAEVCERLASALVRGDFGAWDEIVMPSMDGRSPIPVLLQSELARLGFPADCSESGSCPYIPLPETWEAYLAALPASARYLVKRSLRDLEAWAAGTVSLEAVERREDLERGTAILKALHEERWRGEGKQGVFSSRRFERFHQAVMPELWERGALDLIWLSVRNEPIAALYNIVADGTVYFYQSGRRLDLPKRIRPGIVLHAHAIQRAIAAGLREYDFLAGTARYKMELSLATRPLVTLRATRASWVETAREWTDGGIGAVRALRSALRA